MAAKLVKKCPCLRPPIKEIRELDYGHSNLHDVPREVFLYERTLEQLYLDSNQILDLPRELFFCHGIRKISISDNELRVVPPAIGTLTYLQHLDISKNGITDLPENIKSCKNLLFVDASVNPLGKIPDAFTHLVNLTELLLNDAFLDYLPGNFGRLCKLKILELRENHLKTLPNSMNRLKDLEKLDLGHNQFTELSDVCGQLTNLLELWCDHNSITYIHPSIGNLHQLMFFDASKNKITLMPEELSKLTMLADLHLSQNQLQYLPKHLGNLMHLTTLKLEDNRLLRLPNTMGGLTALSELDATSNELPTIPPSLGRLRNLRTLYLDDNVLEFIPAELGSCSGITVLSLRANKLTYLPDELGRIPRLRVLNLSNNLLDNLPFSFMKLKHLQALWLSENQTKPLIPFQTEIDQETGMKVLTCYLLPQSALASNHDDSEDDRSSFHASVWEEERPHRQTIHFKFDENQEKMLSRHPTPYPKDLQERARHVRNMALRENTASNQMTNMEPEKKGKVTEKCILNEDPGKIARPLSPNRQDARKLLKDSTYSERRSYQQSPKRNGTRTIEGDEHIVRDPSPVQSVHSVRSTLSTASEPPRSRPSSDHGDKYSVRRRHSNRASNPSAQTAHQRLRQLPKPRIEGRHARPQSTVSHTDLPPAVVMFDSSKTLVRSYSDSKFKPSEKHSQSSIHLGSARHDLSMQPVVGRRFAHGNKPYESDIGYHSETSQSNRKHDTIAGRRSNRTEDNKPYPRVYYRSNSHHHLTDTELLKTDPDSYRLISLEHEILQQKPRPMKDGYASDLEAYSQRMFSRIDHSSAVSNHIRSNTDKVRSSLVEMSRLSLNQLKNSVNLHTNSVLSDVENYTRVPGKDLPEKVSCSDPAKETYRQNFKVPPKTSSHRNLHEETALHKEVSVEPPPYHPAPPYTVTPPRKTNTPQTLRAYQHDTSLHVDNTNSLAYNSITAQVLHVPSNTLSSTQGSIQERPPRVGDFVEKSFSTEKHLVTSPRVCRDDIHYNSETKYTDYDRMSADKPDYCENCVQSTKALILSPKQIQEKAETNSSLYILSPSSNDFNAGLSQSNFATNAQSTVQNSPSISLYFPDCSELNPSHDISCISDVLNASNHIACLSIETAEVMNLSVPGDLLYKLDTHDGSPSKFEDMDEPISHMSSSTDSGYVHGTNAFENLVLCASDSISSPSSTPIQNIVSPGLIKDANLQYNTSSSPTRQSTSCVFRINLMKNPGFGFSIAGGLGSSGNPFNSQDNGIYVTKVQVDSAAAGLISRGDKIIEVNGVNFCDIQHSHAVEVINSSKSVSLLIQR